MKKSLIISAAALVMCSGLTAQAETYARKVLVEHFTTMQCSNCPKGNNVLTQLSRDYDFVWVAHHVGYHTDELTVDDSNQMLYFGINGAPYAMIDRSVHENGGLAVGIGYPNAMQGSNMLFPYIENALSVPANVGITIGKDYNEDTRELTVTVDLERNEDLPENALLTVQLVENGVEAQRGQAGAPNVKRHNNVYRQSLTDILGDEITWTDNRSTNTYTVTIPNTWNAASTRVVAFVNMPQDRHQPTANYICNANDTEPLVKTIVATDTPVFTPKAGKYTHPIEVSITAAEDAEIRYTLDGTEPDASSTVYTDPFTITDDTTVKAIAYKTGYNPSEIATAEYEIMSSGIDTISTESNSEAEWFDLQGRPVNPDALTPGIYVKRTGDKAARVAVK